MINNGNKILVDIKKNVLLSTEDQVIYAEPLQVLDCVQSNYSITNANTNNEKFKQIFPDSLNHLALSLTKRLQIAWKNNDGYVQYWSNEKTNCQHIVIPVPNAKLLLVIPVVVNNGNVIIVIKYEIVANNASSNYTKINFRSSFLGYSLNENFVITLLNKLTKWITQLY